MQITVATINLRNSQDRWRQRRHVLIGELLNTTPDLISLQEISFPIGQGRWIRNQLNARLPEGKRPYRLIQKRRHHLLHGYRQGIGILTTFPVLYSDWVNLGQNGRVALRANIELPGQKTFDFVATHLHHKHHHQEIREQQAMLLDGWLNSARPVPRRIIAGDFNETPNGQAIRYMKQTYRSAYESVHGHEPLATFPTALAPTDDGWSGCLDYVFLSPTIKTVLDAQIFCNHPSAEDNTLYPSDHVGLLVTLDI